MSTSTTSLNYQVRGFWEQGPCGTSEKLIGKIPPGTVEYYERIEQERYLLEPFIHAAAQFTRHKGENLLEVGIGAGTDHLQWARAGAICHGVDLTDAAIETTRRRFELYGLNTNLCRLDAERLPYDKGSFDVVYSWGVIHHSESPETIVAEIQRVLRPGGRFIGMMYARRSLVACQLWALYGLLRGKPWRSFRDLIWHHMESIGTKAYTKKELLRMFAGFSEVKVEKVLTPYDLRGIPRVFHPWIPNAFGWFNVVDAKL